jgi:HEAT repeat protein
MRIKNKYAYISLVTLISTFIILNIAPLDSQTIPGKKDAPVKPVTNDSDKNKTAEKDIQKKQADTSKKETKPKEVMDDSKKAEKIESTLDFGMQKDRKIAITMIKDIKDEQIKKKLLQKIALIIENDADIDIKKIAVTAIGDNASAEFTPVLIKALDDSAEDVKIAACYALTKVKAESAKPKLVELFRKQNLTADSNLTDAIISALRELNSPEILDTAVTAAKDIKTSKMIREKLILYIGKTGSAAQKSFLLELYKNDDEDIILRSYSVNSLAKLKLKEAAPDIKAVIKDIDSYPFGKKKKYYELYMHSVAALVEMGDADSVPLLMNSLRSDNAGVRLKALNLIKEFNDERTIDILKYKMKNDPSKKIRKAARKALEEKGIIEKGKDSDDVKEDYGKEDKDE